MNCEINILLAILAVAGAKAILFGSDWSPFLWFKYRKEYSSWYANRSRFRPLPQLRIPKDGI